MRYQSFREWRTGAGGERRSQLVSLWGREGGGWRGWAVPRHASLEDRRGRGPDHTVRSHEPFKDSRETARRTHQGVAATKPTRLDCLAALQGGGVPLARCRGAGRPWHRCGGSAQMGAVWQLGRSRRP